MPRMRPRSGVINCAVLAFSVLVLCPASSQILAGDVSVAELDNGIRIIVKPAHDVPVVSIVAVVRGGSSVEGPEQRGLAHIVEHMVFQEPVEGTTTGLLPQTIESLGGEVRAETSADATKFIVTTYPEGMAESIAALGLALGAPVLQPARLRAELDIMEKELDEVYASPIVALRTAATKALFGDGPYARSAGGGPADLPRYTVSDVAEFHEAHYIGANMSIIVVGDTTPEDVMDAVSKAFGLVPEMEPTTPVLAEEPTTPNAVIEAPGGQPLVGLAFVAPGMDDPSAVLATDVLLAVLDHSNAGQLNVQLPRALQGVGSMGTGYLTQRLPGHLYIWVEPREASPDATIGVVKSILAGIRDNGVTAEELERATNAALVTHALGADTYTTQAETIAFYEAIGSCEFGVQYEDLILRVTSGDIQRVMSQYFNPDRALVLVGSEGP